MVTAATRREARERAVELLYEAETKGIDVDEVVDALPLDPDAYALELARGVIDHHIELDRVLVRYARKWPIERMAVVDRTVLRLGTLELATKHDVPTGVALSESVELGGRYGSTDDTSRFVNGILAAVADEVRGTRPWRPRTVVFDLDGVIRHWKPEWVLEQEEHLGLEPGVIAAAAFAHPGYGDVTVGRISAEEWAAQIGAAVAETEDVDADVIADLWLNTTWRLDDDVVAIVRALRDAGTPTALFSNASSRLEQDMDKMGITALFDVVANSSRIAMAKPDPAAFEHVAGMIGAEGGELLFVDDRADNVGGAIDAGWHAVQMQSANRLAGVLRRLEVPGAPAHP